MSIYEVVSMNKFPGLFVVGANTTLESELAGTLARYVRISYESFRPWDNYSAGTLELWRDDFRIPVFKGTEVHGHIRLQEDARQRGVSDMAHRDYAASTTIIERPQLKMFFNTPQAWEERQAFLEYLRTRHIHIR